MAFEKPKKKWGKALWASSTHPHFVAQQKQLRPENTKAGGVKARSASEEVRMAIYRSIAELYKRAHPFCETHPKIFPRPASSVVYRPDTSDIHHTQGRDGLLLFDTRYWLGVCRECHTWIHDHPEEAKKKGLLA